MAQTYLSERKHAILRQLRYGPLDQFQIAADIGEAPFLVRAELQGLKRERLVSMDYDRRSVLWELTDRGVAIAWGDQQLRIV